MPATDTRISLLREILYHWASFTFSVIFAIAGIIDLVIGKYGSPDVQNAWNNAFKHPLYGWKTWLLTFALLLIVLGFEKCYKIIQGLREQIAALDKPANPSIYSC